MDGFEVPPPRRLGKPSFWALYALTLLFVVAATWIAQRRVDPFGVGTDDANIVFRYAKHLFEGHGLVWNTGGERVEGFSSPLWLAVTTALVAIPHFESWLRGVSILLVAAGQSLLIAALLSAVGASGRHARLRAAVVWTLGMAWVLAFPAFFVWTTVSLLETGLWSGLLLAGAVWSSELSLVRAKKGPRPPPVWIACLCLSVLVRPEGLLISLVLIAIVALAAYRSGGVRSALARVRAGAIAVGLVAIAMFATRRAYFGYWLPNTYYAKLGNDHAYHLRQGFTFFRDCLKETPVLWPAFASAVVSGLFWLVLCLRRRPLSRHSDLLLSLAGPAGILAVAGFLVTIVEGGDHFPGWRPFQPFWPLFIVPIAFVSRLLAGWFEPALRVRLPWFVAAAVVAFAASQSLHRWRALTADPAGLPIEFELAHLGRSAGADLDAMFPGPSKPRLGVIAAGGVGFAYEGDVVDLMGINDVRMAHATRARYGLHGHSAFDAATFYDEAPDIIVSSGRECALEQPAVRLVGEWIGTLLRGIADERRFRSLYVPVTLSAGRLRGSRRGLCEWAKRAFLGRRSTEAATEIIPERASP